MSVVKTYGTPGGHHIRLAVRPDTADEAMTLGILFYDEYGIEHMDLQPGDLFLDIGAYIGAVGLTVAADFPGVRVVMVEAVPENVALISESIHANGWQDRCWVIHGAASNVSGKTTIPYGAGDDDTPYNKDNRFVGGMGILNATTFLEVPNVTLKDIWLTYGDIDMLKIDCEGCEYAFLDTKGLTSIEYIIGEWHDGDTTRIKGLLDKTHDFKVVRDDSGIGIFEAKRR